ncbi:hypothetical protein KKC52_12640 [bacterium]|nr:hypothetical protein [bacterium]
MPVCNEAIHGGDSVGVRIFRGTGEVENAEVKLEKSMTTSNPVESALLLSGRMEGKTLVEWQTAMWQSLMVSVGQGMLGVPQKKFFYRARIELVGGAICQKCLCSGDIGCLAMVTDDAAICENFIPKKDAVGSLWQWILQSRILPYTAA